MTEDFQIKVGNRVNELLKNINDDKITIEQLQLEALSNMILIHLMGGSVFEVASTSEYIAEKLIEKVDIITEKFIK